MTTVLLITLLSILSTSYSSSRVVNHHATESSHFSSCYVSLQWGEPPIIPFFHVCAGGVIDEQWILTAGHCVEAMRQLLPPGKGVFMAVPKIDESHRMENDIQKFSVDGLFPHDEFNFSRGVGGPYDIGLIKLDKPINVNGGLIEKAQLPVQNADVLEGEKATVYEWGRMRTVIVPIVGKDECNEAIQKAARVKGVTIKKAVNDANICTTSPADEVLLCYGDSGGPLTVRKANGQREIVGVASWVVLPCGGKGTPAVWTKVSSYVDWIERLMKNN